MANPNSSGTAYTTLASMVQLFGEEEGFGFMKGLHANINQYTKSGSAPIKAAGRGETTIGIVFMHDAVAQAVDVVQHLPERAAVWAIDADGLMVRPGPRLVDGVEALASIFHADVMPAAPATSVRQVR